VARRIGSTPSGLPLLLRFLSRQDNPAIHLDGLRGLHAALVGRRQVPMPEEWRGIYRKFALSPNAEVRDKAMLLAVVFDDPQAIAALRKLLLDSGAALAARQSALQALIYQKNPDLAPVLHTLLTDRTLRGAAIRGLAAFNHASTPEILLRHYASLTEDEKADAIHTLTARPAYALALLDAVERGQVPRRDLSAFTVRQMQALKNKPLNEKLAKVWGVLRPASQEKAVLMTRYKALLTPESVKSADRSHGRMVYARTCASCHTLFGEGGNIGPELTGSQRTNLDYLLENILDPSAVVASDYQVTVLLTKDGRVITGIIKQETDKVVTVQTQNEVIPVPQADIEERRKSPISMMPEGLLEKLSREEVRDLIAYLGSPMQVPLPAKTPKN
jgi:putative heme-binding domain-containing protein